MDVPVIIQTVGDLIQWLQCYHPDLLLDVKYDSGHGQGWITPTSFQVIDRKTLRIEVS